MRSAKGYSRDTASIAHVLTRGRSILTPDGSDDLAKNDAQADAAIARLRQAAQAARDRLEAGLYAIPKKPAEPDEPIELEPEGQPPLVAMDDLNPPTDDLF